MAILNPAIQKLRQLGLTRTEAEVYLATLQQATGGPVSAYKVAQAMGRDPANLGKKFIGTGKARRRPCGPGQTPLVPSHCSGRLCR